jgi:tetratricopeptide (TPR) repeat protein
MKQAVVQEKIARSRPLNHNTLWRRIKRRVFVGPAWSWPLAAMYSFPWLGVVVAIDQDLPWVFRAAVRWLWLVSCLLQLCLGVSSIIIWVQRTHTVVKYRGHVYSILLMAACLVSLALGRLDWAVFIHFVWDLISHTALFRAKPVRRIALQIIIPTIIIAAVITHLAWLAGLGCVLALVESCLFSRRALEVAQGKPSPSQHRQKQLEVGEWRGKTTYLRALCEAEMWEEAAEQLENLKDCKEVDENEVRIWTAKILLGKDQFEDIIKLFRSKKERTPQLLVPLAVAYARLGDLSQASEMMSRSSVKRCQEATIAQGHILMAEGNYEAALLWYEHDLQWSHLNTARARAAHSSGKALAVLGDYREAAAAYAQAIRFRPFLKQADVTELVQCLRKLGKDSEAARWEQLVQDSQAAVSVQ